MFTHTHKVQRCYSQVGAHRIEPSPQACGLGPILPGSKSDDAISVPRKKVITEKVLTSLLAA